MSNFSKLQKRLNRWQQQIDKSSFLIKEISARLLERLDVIKLNPAVILDASHVFHNQAQGLLQRYPDALIIAASQSSAFLSKPPKLWQRWQKTTKAMVSDLHHLPLADESVDFIFSNCLLYNSNNIRELIQEWFRILKPNGLILFSSLGPDTLKEFRAANRGAHNPFVDMHDIGDMLLHQGFSDPVMDMEMLTVYYKNFTQLLKDVRVNSTLVSAANYPGKIYFDRLEQAYQIFKLADDTLPLTCEVVYGHAWKLKKAAKGTTGEFSIPLTKIKR